MSLHLWSLIMAIILASSGNWNNTTSNTKQEAIIPEEAIVCEAEAELDGCGTSCAYPKGWEWLENLHETGLLKKIEIGQPVWRVSNSRGWKAKLVFAELDTD